MSSFNQSELKAFLTLILVSIDDEVSGSEDVSTLVHLPRGVLKAKIEEFLSTKTVRQQREASKALMAQRRAERQAEQERVKRRNEEFAKLRSMGIAIPREVYRRSKPNNQTS
jgi:hypothetical protein